MTYVYRDPDRLHGRPVHVPEERAAPVLVADVPHVESEPAPIPPKPDFPPPKTKSRPLPPPVWGGRLGLELAYAEVNDWERRNPRHQPTEREQTP